MLSRKNNQQFSEHLRNLLQIRNNLIATKLLKKFTKNLISSSGAKIFDEKLQLYYYFFIILII